MQYMTVQGICPRTCLLWSPPSLPGVKGQYSTIVLVLIIVMVLVLTLILIVLLLLPLSPAQIKD